ncbi:MAG TPA: hypothetical protein VJQ25_01770 [Nitrospira sp.]|nr:hypothetical protein [Nitrospira sp.]
MATLIDDAHSQTMCRSCHYTYPARLIKNGLCPNCRDEDVSGVSAVNATNLDPTRRNDQGYGAVGRDIHPVADGPEEAKSDPNMGRNDPGRGAPSPQITEPAPLPPKTGEVVSESVVPVGMGSTASVTAKNDVVSDKSAPVYVPVEDVPLADPEPVRLTEASTSQQIRDGRNKTAALKTALTEDVNTTRKGKKP